MATLLVCLGGPTAAQANTGEVLCAQLAERKYYMPAVDCYQKEAKKIPHSASMKEGARLRKGGYLREAARNLDRAANAAKKPEVAARLREKAVATLQRVLTLGLVRRKAGKRRGRLIKIMLSKIKAKIGYTPLAISTAAKDAKIEVTGHQFKATAIQKYNQSLRPGPYTVRVKYNNESVWRTKKVVLAPGKPVVLTFVSRPAVPTISWIGYAVGGAAIVAGGVMLGYGLASLANYNSCQGNANCGFVKATNIPDATESEKKATICQPGDTRATCKKLQACLLFERRTGLTPLQKEKLRPEFCGGFTSLFGDDLNELYQPGVIFSVVGASTIAVGATLLTIAIVAHARSRKRDTRQKETISAAPTTRSGASTYTLLSTHAP